MRLEVSSGSNSRSTAPELVVVNAIVREFPPVVTAVDVSAAARLLPTR